jgi:hypothetical protein
MGGIAWHALSARLPNSLAGSSRRDASVWMVLGLWFAWRWAPFVPHFTLAKLKGVFLPFFDPTFDAFTTLSYLIWWVVIAQVVFIAMHARRGVEMLLLVIAAVLVGRLFVADPTFVPAELLAHVILLPTLVVLHRLVSATRTTLVLASYVAVFVYEQLFASPRVGGHFELWPFLRWMDAGYPVDLPSLSKSLFEFAALIWLLKDAGFAPRFTTWLVPIAVLVLEIAAVAILGGNGSLTPPALAAMVAALMFYTSGDRRGEAIPQRVRSR